MRRAQIPETVLRSPCFWNKVEKSKLAYQQFLDLSASYMKNNLDKFDDTPSRKKKIVKTLSSLGDWLSGRDLTHHLFVEWLQELTLKNKASLIKNKYYICREFFQTVTTMYPEFGDITAYVLIHEDRYGYGQVRDMLPGYTKSSFENFEEEINS